MFWYTLTTSCVCRNRLTQERWNRQIACLLSMSKYRQESNKTWSQWLKLYCKFGADFIQISIRAMTAFAHHNKGRPKKRMGIAGHDFAGGRAPGHGWQKQSPCDPINPWTWPVARMPVGLKKYHFPDGHLRPRQCPWLRRRYPAAGLNCYRYPRWDAGPGSLWEMKMGFKPAEVENKKLLGTFIQY